MPSVTPVVGKDAAARSTVQVVPFEEVSREHSIRASPRFWIQQLSALKVPNQLPEAVLAITAVISDGVVLLRIEERAVA